MDFNNNDEDEEGILVIEKMEQFIKEVYMFSLLNLDVTLSPEVKEEKDPIRKQEIKNEIMEGLTLESLDNGETEDMLKMYPLKRVEDAVKEKIQTNEDNQNFITIPNLEIIVVDTSRAMLYSLFDKLHRDGVVDLFWDDKKGDFAYGLKKGAQVNEIPKVKQIKKKTVAKKKKVTPRKKK
jgi:hypothetical protein